MANKYEDVAKDAILTLKDKGGDASKIWENSCKKYNEDNNTKVNYIKGCPKNTFLWIIKYILCDESIIVDIKEDNKNGLYSGIAINELLKDDKYIIQNSPDLWQHIRSLKQTKINVPNSYNRQIDVVKGLWGEILNESTNAIKSRLINVGIQNV